MPFLNVRSRADCPSLKRAAAAIEQAAWNDLGYLNYTRAHYDLYGSILERFADCQLCLVDDDSGYPVAVANCVPVAWNGDVLPSEGWDWLVEHASNTTRSPTALGALAISVPANHRAKGYARRMIRAMQELAMARGLSALIAPVRPSSKARHPYTSINEYVGWTDDAGRPYDPWLRSHVAAGGVISGPCERSMVVDEPLGFWETWSNQTFSASGDYTMKGALVPVSIDVEQRRGRYEEPNVWVTYRI
jgi:GNAT superfamily N-acetyltransferase